MIRAPTPIMWTTKLAKANERMLPMIPEEMLTSNWFEECWCHLMVKVLEPTPREKDGTEILAMTSFF